MSTTQVRPLSSLDRLVTRLEQDIHQRGPCAGDKYWTASEAAAWLGVSTATADRAMQILSKRQMLVRRRNLGTFVGPHFERKRNIAIRTVYVLVPPTGLGKDVVSLESFAEGFRSQIHDANVQLSYLPANDVADYVRELMGSALLAGRIAGFVPFSCPHEVYHLLADSGIPTVVLGTPYGDQQNTASVDVDNREAGRLLVKHLIELGHRRIALFTPVDGRPGDNCFYDGVSEALTASGLPHNALIVRILPPEPSILAVELGALLGMPDRPTALIGRPIAMARAASAALDRLELDARVCPIVCQTGLTAGRGEWPFTCVQPRLSLAEIAARVGEMLERIGKGEVLDERHAVIPVELCRKTA